MVKQLKNVALDNGFFKYRTDLDCSLEKLVIRAIKVT